MPVGRGMKTIDIDGINENARIFAQVSFSDNEKEIEEKIQQLKALGNLDKKIIYIYFGPKEKEAFAARIADNVRYISLEEVFAKMRDTGIIEDMLNYSTLSSGRFSRLDI